MLRFVIAHRGLRLSRAALRLSACCVSRLPGRLASSPSLSPSMTFIGTLERAGSRHMTSTDQYSRAALLVDSGHSWRTGDARTLRRMQEWARPSLPMRWGNPGQQPPFVGRRDDLAVLEEAWAAVAAGAGRAVFVGGEPGAGKSRLVAEAARVLYGQQATVLLGSCVAELGAPYEPFDEPLRTLMPAIGRGQVLLEEVGATGDHADQNCFLPSQAERRPRLPRPSRVTGGRCMKP